MAGSTFAGPGDRPPHAFWTLKCHSRTGRAWGQRSGTQQTTPLRVGVWKRSAAAPGSNSLWPGI